MILAAAGTSKTGKTANRRRSRSGFSLMEVILALAIFLMSLVAIAGLVDMGMEREVDSQLQVRGARLAQSKMGEIVSGALPMSATTGKFDNESEWSFDVQTAPSQSGVPNLFQVTVKVSRDNRGQPFEYTLAQLVINPLMTGSAQAATATTDQGSATPPALSGTPPTQNTGTGSGGMQ